MSAAEGPKPVDDQPAARETGERRLRAALWTWSRRDRRASGEVVLDTARDLIDHGGSINKEARALARTGLVLRARGTARDLRAAPWQAAAPLVLVATATLCMALLVADAGGWGLIWPGEQATYSTYAPDRFGGADNGELLRWLYNRASDWLFLHGAQVFVAVGAALVVAALAGARWLTVPLAAALAIVAAGWIRANDRLGYVTTVSIATPEGIDPNGPIQASITMSAVVGLLLALALITALAWAITGTFARRRGDGSASGHSQSRSRRASFAIGALAAAAVVAGPFAAAVASYAADLADPGEPLLAYGAQTIYLLVGATVLTFGVALATPRRAPSAAVASVLVSAALWGPALWLGTGVWAINGLPFDALLGEGSAALLFWGYSGVGGLLLGVWALARAGRASAGNDGPTAAATAPPGSSASATTCPEPSR